MNLIWCNSVSILLQILLCSTIHQYHLLQDEFSGFLLWKTKSGRSENKNWSASQQKNSENKKNPADCINIFRFFIFFIFS